MIADWLIPFFNLVMSSSRSSASGCNDVCSKYLERSVAAEFLSVETKVFFGWSLSFIITRVLDSLKARSFNVYSKEIFVP